MANGDRSPTQKFAGSWRAYEGSQFVIRSKAGNNLAAGDRVLIHQHHNPAMKRFFAQTLGYHRDRLVSVFKLQESQRSEQL